MKYFTRELWEGFQDSETAETAFRKWDENLEVYRLQLQQLESRLSAGAFSFFSDADVHDGRLESIRIAEKASTGGGPEECPVSFELQVVHAAARWQLNYSVVRRVLVDYPSANPLFHSPGLGFEDWDYHELTDAGDGCLRHEVLFASGSILLIEFRDITVTSTASDEPGAA